MMMAVQSGNIHLLAECLNSNMNPFLKDGLGQTALDYAKQFPDTTFGTDMTELINDAMVQWGQQTTEEERTGDQVQVGNVFNEFNNQ